MRERVAEARVARLATVRPDGHPHLVPITFALDGDTMVTAIDHKPKSTSSLQRLRNIRANPAASVLVDHYDDDWTRLWWVLVRGHARVLEAGEEAERALALLVAKYEQYGQAAPGPPVLAIDIDEWRGWAASS